MMGLPLSPPMRTFWSMGTLPRKFALHALRHLLAAAVAKDIHARAVRQVEVGHVLDHAQDRHFQLAEHHQPAAGILERDQLRQGHDDRAAEGDGLREREHRVTGSRRQVHDEVIQFAPVHVAQELADGGVQHRSAPDQRLTGFHQQTHRDDFHVVGFGGSDLLAPGGGSFCDAHHGGDVRSVDVRVHQADARAALGQRDRDVDRDGALAHAALARADRDGILDGRVHQPAHRARRWGRRRTS